MYNKFTHKTDPTTVKQNDLMAFVHYVKVQSLTGDALLVTDVDHGNRSIEIRGKELIESAFSADQFQETVKVSKTQVAEILISSPNRPLTISFVKADGSKRVLRGRLVKPEPLLGRSMVEDLDTTDINRLRQVDHRTLQFVIVEGVKYVVK